MSSEAPAPLYLASASPRRAQLLHQLGLRFATLSAEVEERVRPGERAQGYVERLARAKAAAGWHRLGAGCEAPVLGADTAISLDGDILGKPRDRDHALNMLAQLSGRAHEVYSAVALAVSGETVAVRTQVSAVYFRRLSEAECEAYWATGEPRDKAGSYAIQGLGAIFIQRLEGSYSAVMGLPLYETAELLREAGLEVLNDK